MSIRFKRHRRVRQAVAALLIGSFGVAHGNDLTTWRSGTTTAKSDAGFVMMAAKRGFAAHQGLDLENVQFTDDATMLHALISGDLDSFEASPGSALVAASVGADVKILGCYWPGMTYSVIARSNVRSIEDLKGKTVAITTPHSLPDLVFRLLLAANGIGAADVKFVNLGNDINRFQAVASSKVDATAISSEWNGTADALGVTVLANVAQIAPQFLHLCTVTTSRTIAERGDEAVAYLQAQMNAEEYALSHRAETLALTREMTGLRMDDPRPAYIYDMTVREKLIDPSMPLPVDKLEWMQEMLVKIGSLKAPLDVSTVVDGSIRTVALRKRWK